MPHLCAGQCATVRARGTKVEVLCMVRSLFGAVPKSCSFNHTGTQKGWVDHVTLTLPQLIDSILKDLHLQHNMITKTTPAMSTVLLHKDVDCSDMSPEFHFRSIIRKLNFLKKSTRVDLYYSVHQCAHFSESPKELHAHAVKRLGCYLLGTKDRGIVLCPDKSHGSKSWGNLDYSGYWRQGDTHLDPLMAKS